MLLKTSNGGNLTWTTSSTSAGFECKLNFVYIFCNLFTFHFFLFHACAQWGPPFFGVQARLDSTPHDCLSSLRGIMNELLHKSAVPSSWRTTQFQLLPKTHRARVPADFRPIANLRLLYKSLCLFGAWPD